jgi:hypothetical protein
MDVRLFLAVLLAGLLAGSELTSFGIVHPRSGSSITEPRCGPRS